MYVLATTLLADTTKAPAGWAAMATTIVPAHRAVPATELTTRSRHFPHAVISSPVASGEDRLSRATAPPMDNGPTGLKVSPSGKRAPGPRHTIWGPIGKALASVTAEAIARRPGIRFDAQECFAYSPTSLAPTLDLKKSANA
jgi:hypothetical protein